MISRSSEWHNTEDDSPCARPARLRRLWLAVLIAAAFVPSARVHAQEVPARSGERDVDVPALIRESKERSDRNWEEVVRHYSDYTFKWRKVQRETGDKGAVKERSELYEIYVPTAKCKPKGCRREAILLEKDGKPVSPERIEKERLKAGERLEKAEREAEQSPPEEGPGRLNWMRFFVRFKRVIGADKHVRLDGQEILEKCDFTRPRRERVGGREMIALDFRPRPGAAFSDETRYLPQVEGRIWVDALDKVIVRLAAWPRGAKFDDTASDQLLNTAALAYDLVRTKEGIWFFRLGRVNGDRHPDLFLGMKKDFSIEQFDYARFKVEVGEEQLVSPDKPR